MVTDWSICQTIVRKRGATFLVAENRPAVKGRALVEPMAQHQHVVGLVRVRWTAEPHPATPPLRSRILRFCVLPLAPPRQRPWSSELPPSSSCGRRRTCHSKYSHSESSHSNFSRHPRLLPRSGRGGGKEMAGRWRGGGGGSWQGGDGEVALLLGLLVLVLLTAVGAEAILAAALFLDEDLLAILDVDHEAVLAWFGFGLGRRFGLGS